MRTALKYAYMFCAAFLVTLSAFAAGTFDLVSHDADGFIDNSATANSGSYVICGTSAASTNTWYNGIVFFKLPTNRIEAANLTFTVAITYGNWANGNAAIDVWGLGYMSTPLMSNAWKLTVDTDTRSPINMWPYNVPCAKIADNLVPAGQTVATGSAWSLSAGQRANLAAFLNMLYEKGAMPGDYAVIRVNHDAAMTVANTNVRFGGSNNTSPDYRTKLTVTLSDAPAPTAPDTVFQCYSHSNDGTVTLAGGFSAYELISGTLGNPTVDGSGIAFFPLPEQPMTTASLAFTVTTAASALSNANIDVWGLGYLGSPVLDKAWLCTNDVDSRVLLNACPPVKLADNIVTSGQALALGTVWQPTAAQSGALLDYLNRLYSRGAKPGDYAVIRLNMDSTQAGETTTRGARWGGSWGSNNMTAPSQRAALSGVFPLTSNYLANAGFESGSGASATGWTLADNGFVGQRTNATPRFGAYTFRVAVKGDQSANTATNLNLYQDVNTPGFAGRLVTFSGFVRHNAAEPLVTNTLQKVEFRLGWLVGGSPSAVVTSVAALLPTDLKDEYKPIAVSGLAPANATGVRAQVVFYTGTYGKPAVTNGAAIVDDLRLTVFEPLPSSGTMFFMR